jgi:hypothetical protein
LDENIKTKIEHEISRIEKLISSAKPLLDLCKIKDPGFVEITAAAQILHSFYNGVEGVIILFFKSVNEELPNDNTWHKTLFEMAFGNNSRKITIIRNDIKEIMEDYLLYRHFIRHSYSSELRWKEMKHLVILLEETWQIVKNDFEIVLGEPDAK